MTSEAPFPSAWTTWVRDRLAEPTEIQELSWPVLRGGANALLVAPTGTGKTEAALVPLLEEAHREGLAPIAILYISPLRALNRDLEGRLIAMAQAMGATVGVRHGDTPQSVRTRQSKSPPHLLITTPETLQLLLIGKNLRLGLAQVRAVVVDEVHELAASDRGAQLAVSLDRLDLLAGRRVRRVGLSATVGDPTSLAEFLDPRGTPRVLVVPGRKSMSLSVTSPPATPPASVASSLPSGSPPNAMDDAFLRATFEAVDEIRGHHSTLVFSNTRPTAERLGAYLHRLAPDLPLAVHHGSLSRELREESEVSFREGKLKALVATSSLELGIDIGVADHVIQFGSPHRIARLLQRVGRSGHRRELTSSGTVVTLEGADLEEAAVIGRRALAGMVEPVPVRRKNAMTLAQQLVATLRQEGTVPVEELHRRLCAAVPTRDLTREEFEEVLRFLEGLGCLRFEGDSVHRGRRTLERFYATLSMIPEEKSYPLIEMGTRRTIGTLDERFVLTKVLSRPDFIFLLHGTTWKMVKADEDGLLVEPVQELGDPPHWEGDDIPVPFEVAQEVGALRRTGDLAPYPLSPSGRGALASRLSSWSAHGHVPSDRVLTAEVHGRYLVLGYCFGTQVNNALATLVAGLATARMGARAEVRLVTPVWIVVELPAPVAPDEVPPLLRIDPPSVDELLERLVPGTEEYRWTFVVVARKMGLIGLSYEANEVRRLEPLMEAHRHTLVGREALAKVLHEKFDAPRAREVMERLGRGELALDVHQGSAHSPGNEALQRLRWQEVPQRPPPTLLRAVRDRLLREELTLVCLRCGFQRTVTPGSYASAGSSPCLACRGVLTAVLSPHRRKELLRLSRYVAAKRKGRVVSRPAPGTDPQRFASAYLSAELLASHGGHALLVMAGRGIGPETARRILSRPYDSEEALLTEILRAERNYARTREFWD